MSPKDYFELTELQKRVLILNWNEERKAEEQAIKKAKSRRR